MGYNVRRRATKFRYVCTRTQTLEPPYCFCQHIDVISYLLKINRGDILRRVVGTSWSQRGVHTAMDGQLSSPNMNHEVGRRGLVAREVPRCREVVVFRIEETRVFSLRVRRMVS